LINRSKKQGNAQEAESCRLIPAWRRPCGVGHALRGSGPGWAEQGRDDPLGCGIGKGGEGTPRGCHAGGRAIDRNEDGQRGTDAVALFLHILGAVAFLRFAAVVPGLPGCRILARLAAGVMIVRTVRAGHVRRCLGRRPHCHAGSTHAPGGQPAGHQRDGEKAAESDGDDRFHAASLAVQAGDW